MTQAEALRRTELKHKLKRNGFTVPSQISTKNLEKVFKAAFVKEKIPTVAQYEKCLKSNRRKTAPCRLLK